MKNEKTPSYIKVGILTILTTIFWIFFSVYRTLTTQTAPNVPANVLAPFNPALDTDKIVEIESRISFEEGQAPLLTVETPSPTPLVEEQPTAVPTQEELTTDAPTPIGTPIPGEEAQ